MDKEHMNKVMDGGASRMLYVQNLKQMYRKFEKVSTAVAAWK